MPGQFLFGWQTRSQSPKSYFERELWAGEHGLAAALHVRSTGRLFTEAKLGFAGAGLPLVTGDAPTAATVGYDLSSAVGVRSGFGAGQGQHGAALAQLYARAACATFTLSRFGQQFASDINVNGGGAAQGTLGFTRGQGTSALNALGDVALRHGAELEARAYFSSPYTSDIAVTYRFDREHPSALLGAEVIGTNGARHVGPIAGFSAPITRTLSAGIELHPLSRGKALRFTLGQTFLGGSAHVRQRSMLVETTSDAPDAVFVLIDGVRTTALAGHSATIAIPSGVHFLSLQSAGGGLASPEQRITDGLPSPVVLPLYPVVRASGRVRIAGTQALLGTAPSLAGITVVIKPANITAQTDAAGNFSFPALAIDPNSTISVDAASLPEGFAPPAEQGLTNGPGTIDMVLRSNETIERVHF
jgi:hypothetical protein